MYQTASPYVYVSSTAIDLSGQEEEEAMIHPKSLFTDTSPPPSFLSSKFHYVSPKEFAHELPTAPIPEVAFLGRSNVGKSSLLNALTEKHLARISKTPGRTQQVNYFGLFPKDASGNTVATGGKSKGKGKSKTLQDQNVNINQALGYIIDLPGYGYAKAPDQLVDTWQINTQSFLTQRIQSGNLQRIYILIDARRGLSLFDRSILSWLEENEVGECDYTIVLTKTDTVSKAQIIKFANEICFRYHAQALGDDNNVHDDIDAYSYPCQSPFVHVTSSKKEKQMGIIDLMWAIDADFLKGSNDLKLLNAATNNNPKIGGWAKEDS